MSSKLRYDITVDETALSVDASLNLNKNAQEEGIVRVGNYLRESLQRGISVNVVTGIVQATGTFTFTGLPVNDEVLTINGVTFTAKTSGATGNEFSGHDIQRLSEGDFPVGWRPAGGEFPN